MFFLFLLCPVFGYIIDKFEYRLKFTIIPTTILLISYMMLFSMLKTLQNNENYSYLIIIPILALGMSYSLYAVSIWILFQLKFSLTVLVQLKG